MGNFLDTAKSVHIVKKPAETILLSYSGGHEFEPPSWT